MAADKEKQRIGDMLLVGFTVQSGCNVSIQDVVTHLEIWYKVITPP